MRRAVCGYCWPRVVITCARGPAPCRIRCCTLPASAAFCCACPSLPFLLGSPCARIHRISQTRTRTRAHAHTHTHMQRVCIYLGSAHVYHLHRVTARRPLYPRVRSLLPSAGRSSPECMHTTHTYIHINMPTCTHTCTHAYVHALMHACMHTCIHTCMHARHVSAQNEPQRRWHQCHIPRS